MFGGYNLQRLTTSVSAELGVDMSCVQACAYFSLRLVRNIIALFDVAVGSYSATPGTIRGFVFFLSIAYYAFFSLFPVSTYFG